MAQPWRLLRHARSPASGPWNMGVDEALARSAEAGVASLRFYRFRGPWLSLGYGQKADPERLTACRAAGVGVVHRATGGSAVLHGSDLTYSVAAPCDALPDDAGRGLAESYRFIGRLLVHALCELGLDGIEAHAELGAGRAEGASPRRFDCFAEPAQHELVWRGAKLVGSAQRRSRGTFLQHGSIRLAPDPPLVVCATGLGFGNATSLAEAGCSLAIETLQAGLERAFERALGTPFQAGLLSAAEQWQAQERVEKDTFGPTRPGREPLATHSRVQLDGR